MEIESLPPELFKSEPEAVLYSWVMYINRHIQYSEKMSFISHILDYTDIQKIELPWNVVETGEGYVKCRICEPTFYNFHSGSYNQNFSLILSEDELIRSIALEYTTIHTDPKIKGTNPIEKQIKEIKYYRDQFGYIRVGQLSWNTSVFDAENDFIKISNSTLNIYPLEDGVYRVNLRLSIGDKIEEINYHSNIHGQIIDKDNRNYFLSYKTDANDTAQRYIIENIAPYDQKQSLMKVSLKNRSEDITVPFNPDLNKLFDSLILI